MRALLLLLAFPLLATFAPVAMIKTPARPASPAVWAEPVPLNEIAPAERRLGRLTYLGGWWLRSNHPDFGGISAMHVADGAVAALSDSGQLIRFALPNARGRTPLSIMPLPDLRAEGKKQRDTEAMAVHGNQAWVAFERRNAIHRYRLPGWELDARATPAAMRDWSANSGSEAMVRLGDGRFLVFCEGKWRGDGSTEVLLFDADPAVEGAKSVSLRYRAPSGYRITDAAQLPDGRLLLLTRRVGIPEGFSAKLVLVERPQLERGAILEGQEIAHFAPPVTTDNYEALSIGRERGRTIVWIASDDNFIELERTLLLKFALE